jgi:hypothetical protein
MNILQVQKCQNFQLSFIIYYLNFELNAKNDLPLTLQLDSNLGTRPITRKKMSFVTKKSMTRLS